MVVAVMVQRLEMHKIAVTELQIQILVVIDILLVVRINQKFYKQQQHQQDLRETPIKNKALR